MKTLADFTALVQLCLKVAAEKYGEMPNVSIRYDLTGRCAGMAGCRREFRTGKAVDLYLRFNREAIQKNWDEMVNQTISHEVAHLVAYCFPELGAKNHNPMWKAIDRSLGGSGARCHQMELTPARARNRYRYVLASGQEISVGPKHHRALQMGSVLTMKRSKERVTKEHYRP